MVRTLRFHCQGCRFDPGRGTKVLQAMRCGQKKKRKEIFLREPKERWRRESRREEGRKAYDDVCLAEASHPDPLLGFWFTQATYILTTVSGTQ